MTTVSTIVTADSKKDGGIGHVRLEWPVTIRWNERSRSFGIGGHVGVEYAFRPEWRVGLRYDRLWSDNRLKVIDNPEGLDPRQILHDSGLENGHDPYRLSAMLDFSHSEFSRLRLQYEYDQSTSKGDNLWMLQYIYSLGSHGAHQY